VAILQNINAQLSRPGTAWRFVLASMPSVAIDEHCACMCCSCFQRLQCGTKTCRNHYLRVYLNQRNAVVHYTAHWQVNKQATRCAYICSCRHRTQPPGMSIACAQLICASPGAAEICAYASFKASNTQLAWGTHLLNETGIGKGASLAVSAYHRTYPASQPAQPAAQSPVAYSAMSFLAAL
jgi:hypothetical protein